jgi:hypothetical protein
MIKGRRLGPTLMGASLLGLARPAYAHDCSSFSDCFETIAVALLVIAAIAILIAGLIFFAEFLAAAGVGGGLTWALAGGGTLATGVAVPAAAATAMEIAQAAAIGAGIMLMASVAEKHIQGAQRVIQEHIEKINNPGPNGGPEYIPKWLKDIAKHMRNILKRAERLKGQKREAAREYVRRMAEELRQLAEEYGIPWEF